MLWLFSPHAKLPERLPDGWRQEQARISELRRNALAALYQGEDGELKLLQLSEACEAPVLVGELMAGMDAADELESVIHRDDRWRRIRPGFVAARAGTRNQHWIAAYLKQLTDAERLEEALATAQLLPRTSATWDMVESVAAELRDAYWKATNGIFFPASDADSDRAVQELLRVGATPQALDLAGHYAKKLPVETVTAVLKGFAERPGDVRGDAHYQVEQLFERLWGSSELSDDEIVKLELNYLGWLTGGYRASTGLRLFRALANQPDLFAQLVSMLYRQRPDGGDGVLEEPELPPDGREARERGAMVAHRILDAWRGYPGDDATGEERERAAREWSGAVLQRTAADQRRTVGEMEVAKVLARVTAGPDGIWPCVAARELIESHHQDFRDGLGIAKRNRRGVVTKAVFEGGRQEREIEATYRDRAERLREDGRWPETSAFLDRLADCYKREAEREDEEARCERLEAGAEEKGE